MKSWQAEDYQLGATIPVGGTARGNLTGTWRTALVPKYMRWICQECRAPKNECPNYNEGCVNSCQRDCLLCWISCPDSCIVVEDGEIKYIDLNYCKGCGICAEICPRGAIKMVRQD